MPYMRMSDDRESSGYSHAAQRMFLREPGWRVGVKTTSDRAFCHSMTPGEDHYHRLAEGEVFVVRGDEKFCLPCAERMGVLDHEPRSLAEPRPTLEIIPDIFGGETGFDLEAEERAAKKQREP